MNPRHVLVSALACLLVDAPLVAQDEAAFVKSLDSVRRTMNRGKWSDALKRILRVLAEHENQLYVRIRRPEVEELAKQCAFRLEHPYLGFDDLISGKLVSFDPKSGDIVIEYTPERMGDFRDPAAEKRKREEEAKRKEKERRRRGGFTSTPLRFKLRGSVPEGWPTPIWHSMPFRGPYEIEVSGSNYKFEEHSRYHYPGITVLVCVEGDSFCAVESGYSGPNGKKKARIVKYEGKENSTLVEAPSGPFQASLPFRVVVRVSEKSIDAYAVRPGKRWTKNSWRRTGPYLSAKSSKRRTVFGSFGLQADGYDKVIVRGKASPSWIQGLQDERVQQLWSRFSKRFRPRKYLPEWFLESLPKATASEFELEETFPDDIDIDSFEIVGRVFEWLRSKRPDRALRTLAENADDLPASTTEYLRVKCHRAAGQLEEALKSCDKLVESAPTFLHGKELRAALLLELDRPDDALAQYDRAITEHPKKMYLHLDALVLLMRAGRHSEASKRMRAFLTKFGATREILQLQRMLSMIERGPSWPRVHEYRSMNYIVRSDIDKETCREASKVLEEAYILFKNQISWVKRKAGTKKLRVYVFRGQAGYQNYAAQILGDRSPHTAGLYSPSLKQLLIWNLPDRKQMLRTVRHEGFHQYLHSLVGEDIPSWLNEGLAEYYETAERKRSAMRGGQPRPDHSKTLLKNAKRQTPLDKFLFLGPRAFYAKASVHYAQAWHLAHFLQHGPREYRVLFKKLLDELKGGSTAKNALVNTFGSIDLAAMQVALDKYIVPR